MWAPAELVLFQDSIAALLPGSSMDWCAQNLCDLLFMRCMVSLLRRKTRN